MAREVGPSHSLLLLSDPPPRGEGLGRMRKRTNEGEGADGSCFGSYVSGSRTLSPGTGTSCTHRESRIFQAQCFIEAYYVHSSGWHP